MLEAEVENGLPFYALGWADRKLKTIISNVGTTNPGTPSKRRRYKKEMVDGTWETVSFFKEVKRPAMVEEFFSCFATIDRHDHLRQGSLDWNKSGILINGGIACMQQYLECA